MTTGRVHSSSVTTDRPGIDVSPVDCIIVLSFFALWIFAICLFIRQWYRLRLIKPRNHGMRQKPKNLDSVKIVKRCSDSVIYNSYPLAMTRTMAAREKRLERMHTMPAIKVDPNEKSPARSLKQELEHPTSERPTFDRPVYAFMAPAACMRSLTLPSCAEDSAPYGDGNTSPKESHPMLTLSSNR